MSFNRRDLFWYCAGVLSVLAIGALLRALNGPASVPATSAATMHPQPAPSAADPPEAGAQRAGTMDEVLARLESRLAAQGGSDSDWELLAQTYDFVGRNGDAKLARAHQLPPSANGGMAEAQTPAQPARADATVASVTGAVELADRLRSKVPEGLTLFIVAKSIDSPGPPLAIVRTTTGHWPLSFTLDDSNAMLPGRNLSSAQQVSIEARVSRSGMATPQAGDYQSGVAKVDPHAAQSVRLVIDHVIG